MALSSWDRSNLNSSQQSAIQKATDDYNRAMAAGDRAGMDAAHAAAESIRSQAGYSGGGDGSSYIRNSTPIIGKSNTSRGSTNRNSSSGGSSNRKSSSRGFGSIGDALGGIGDSINNAVIGSINSSTGGSYNPTINYNGQSFNLNTDYQKKINEAVAKGDYASAQYYEGIRNAKIDYMNRYQNNSASNQGYNQTNNYTYGSFSDLPDYWTSVNINGNTYTNQGGRYYDSDNNFLGTGWNSNTNSFTYNDRNDAINAAYKYVGSISGLDDYGLTAADYLDYYGQNLSSSFVDAMQTGNVDQWRQQKAQEKKEMEEFYSMLQQQQMQQQQQYEEQLQQQISGSGSGSSTNTSGSGQSNYSDAVNDYMKYIVKQMGRGRVSKF